MASPGSGRSEETVSSSDASAGQSRWDAYVTTEHVSHQFVQSNAEEEVRLSVCLVWRSWCVVQAPRGHDGVSCCMQKFVTEIPGATKRRRGVTERRPAVEQRDEQVHARTTGPRPWCVGRGYVSADLLLY